MTTTLDGPGEPIERRQASIAVRGTDLREQVLVKTNRRLCTRNEDTQECNLFATPHLIHVTTPLIVNSFRSFSTTKLVIMMTLTDAQQKASDCVSLWWKVSWASGNLSKPGKRSNSRKNFVSCQLRQPFELVSYGISPLQHYTMIRACRKSGLSETSEKKAVLININICARILAPALCRPSCFESSA
jgi:hypothetical protein